MFCHVMVPVQWEMVEKVLFFPVPALKPKEFREPESEWTFSCSVEQEEGCMFLSPFSMTTADFRQNSSLNLLSENAFLSNALELLEHSLDS